MQGAAAAPAPPLIVLPNPDGDAHRCPAAYDNAAITKLRGADGRPMSRVQVTGCSDAADHRSNGAADMRDITPVSLCVQ